MVVFLDREGFETALPDVTGQVVVPVVARGMGGQQPVHPGSQVGIRLGPKNEVKVVRHEAPTQHAHRCISAGLAEQGREGSVVIEVMKDLAAAVTEQ